MNRLIIEGQEADLTQEVINIKFQINYIGRIDTRDSTVSNSIDLPKTSNNEKIFGMLNMIGSGSTVPYRKLRCTYFQDNLNLIVNGYLQLTEIDDVSFKCNIFDGIIDLSEKLKGKTLETITYEPIPLNMTSYLNSFHNTSEYIFALAHYDKAYPITDFKNMSWEISKQAPAIYIHSIFDKIMNEAEFTYGGDVFNDPDFKSEVITLSKGYEATNRLTLVNCTSQTREGSMPYTYGQKKHDLTVLETPTSVSVAGATITSNAPQTLALKFNVYINGYNSDVLLGIQKNGAIISEFLVTSNSTTHLFETTVSMATGDKIEIVSSGKKINNVVPSAYYKVSFDLKVSKGLGQLSIDVADSIGSDISQLDLVKDVMQRYGLIMKIDSKNKKHIEFMKLDDLLNDRANAIDLSEKFDRLINTAFKFDYGKVNTAEYKYMDDDQPKDHDGKMLITNQNLKANNELFKSPFTISNKENKKDLIGRNIPVYDVFLWDGILETVEGGADVFNYSNLETKNRIFKVGAHNQSTKFTYFGQTPTTRTAVPILTLDDVGMKYYLNANYTAFNSLMNAYKEITVQMNLNTIDLLKMDFFKLIYLRQYQAYFYLQRYTNNGEVKLLQINKFQ